MPLADEAEKYRVTVWADGVAEGQVLSETGEPRILLSAAEIGTLQTGNISVEIAQVGASGLSPSLAFEIPL